MESTPPRPGRKPGDNARVHSATASLIRLQAEHRRREARIEAALRPFGETPDATAARALAITGQRLLAGATAIGTALQPAAELLTRWLALRRGFAPIPIPHRSKAPAVSGWQRLRIGEADLPHWFNGRPSNVGVLLGEPSGGRIDVDIDHPLARALADEYLPPTDCIWGRAGAAKSHRIYRVTAPVKTRKWSDPGCGSIVELRSDGTQTVAPGSVHPSGEPIEWYADGEPATVNPGELTAALDALAQRVRSELTPALAALAQRVRSEPGLAKPTPPTPPTTASGGVWRGRPAA